MKTRPWLIVAIAFVVGLAILGSFLVQSKRTERSLRIVGYASKEFTSDLVKWNLTIQKTADLDGLKQAYTALAEDVAAFQKYLIDTGIPAKAITIQPVTSNPIYDNFGKIASYNINESIFIITSEMDKVEKLSLNPTFFADRGLLLQNSTLSYLYTKLPELKKKLLADATSDALLRGKEISSAAHIHLGKLQQARAGVFQITEPYSTDVSDYGIYNTNTRNKSISVTITAFFALK